MTVKLPLWLPCLICGCVGLILGLWIAKAQIDTLKVSVGNLAFLLQTHNGGKGR
jgi:hypothetical protein